MVNSDRFLARPLKHSWRAIRAVADLMKDKSNEIESDTKDTFRCPFSKNFFLPIIGIEVMPHRLDLSMKNFQASLRWNCAIKRTPLIEENYGNPFIH